jgi:hypothetical protein
MLYPGNYRIDKQLSERKVKATNTMLYPLRDPISSAKQEYAFSAGKQFKLLFVLSKALFGLSPP